MKKFKKIFVEITNSCNLACSFCPSTSRKKEFMNPSSFEKIAEKISGLSDYVCLHLLGEPLLHPKFDEILFLAKKNKLKINLTTNGTLISKKSETILSSGCVTKICFSIQSLLENGIDEKKKDDCIANILNFCLVASKKGIICELRFWNKGSETENKIQEVLTQIHDFFTKMNEKCEKSKENSAGYKIINNVFVGFDNRFVWPGEAKTLDDNIYCHALKTHFAILVDGTVVPCCLDNNGSIPLGNIFVSPIETILLSEKSQSILKGFECRKAVADLCKKCSFARKF